MRRKTHCIRGHELTPETTRPMGNGQRYCVPCRDLRNQAKKKVRAPVVDQPGERWAPVVGYEGLYEVSSHGRVKSLPRPYGRPGILTPGRGFPYYTFGLCKDGVVKPHKIHRLVASAFIRPPRPGEICRHLDGDPTNHSPENLSWGSYGDNTDDMVRHGVHNQARKTHCDNGHEFTEENTRMSLEPDGRSRRTCRACHRQWKRESRMRRAAA